MPEVVAYCVPACCLLCQLLGVDRGHNGVVNACKHMWLCHLCAGASTRFYVDGGVTLRLLSQPKRAPFSKDDPLFAGPGECCWLALALRSGYSCQTALGVVNSFALFLCHVCRQGCFWHRRA
jgi:hypothetical protein